MCRATTWPKKNCRIETGMFRARRPWCIFRSARLVVSYALPVLSVYLADAITSLALHEGCIPDVCEETNAIPFCANGSSRDRRGGKMASPARDGKSKPDIWLAFERKKFHRYRAPVGQEIILSVP